MPRGPRGLGLNFEPLLPTGCPIVAADQRGQALELLEAELAVLDEAREEIDALEEDAPDGG